jgi:hypothetical protein
MINKLCIAALLLAACAADKSQAGVSASGGGPAKGSGQAAGAGSTMTAVKGTYQAAYQAFLAFAADKLGVAPPKVDGIGPNENIAKLQRGKVGLVWAFETHPEGSMTPELRGWAANDGTVITLEQNLGRLFSEAGVWGSGVSPALTAQQLADTLTWAMGTGYRVFIAPGKGAPAPQLSAEAGAGKLTFFVDFQKPGLGRAPHNVSRIEVALTKDQQATLSRTPIPAP